MIQNYPASYYYSYSFSKYYGQGINKMLFRVLIPINFIVSAIISFAFIGVFYKKHDKMNETMFSSFDSYYLERDKMRGIYYKTHILINLSYFIILSLISIIISKILSKITIMDMTTYSYVLMADSFIIFGSIIFYCIYKLKKK